MGGLSSALWLAHYGYDVTVLEAHDVPGGKARLHEVAGTTFDLGPTVLTMDWVFEDMFALFGDTLSGAVSMTRATTLARHFWKDGTQFDLDADIATSARSIADIFSEEDARGYERLCRDTGQIFETLRHAFIDASRPNPVSLSYRVGLHRIDKLLGLRPFSTHWSMLGDYFHDQRLQQLFGRYSTYCGSSPYLSPATLSLVSHVEQEGVWIPDGGMAAVSSAMASLARRAGVTLMTGTAARRLQVNSDRITGVMLENGEVLRADHIIFNGDSAALPSLLDERAQKTTRPFSERSLSALVGYVVGKAAPTDLAYHNVYFSDNYKREFDQILQKQQAPDDPTIYLCAQDRRDTADPLAPDAPQRYYLLMNMPANGDHKHYRASDTKQLVEAMLDRLRLNGLDIDMLDYDAHSPNDFHRLFPGTGGALYGPATHGWQSTFKRQGARTSIKGLYLAGGSIHPGPGVPMAALSGKQAALCIHQDLRST